MESAPPDQSQSRKRGNTCCLNGSIANQPATHPRCSATPAWPEFPSAASPSRPPLRSVRLPAREYTAAHSDMPYAEIPTKTPARPPQAHSIWSISAGRESRKDEKEIPRWLMPAARSQFRRSRESPCLRNLRSSALAAPTPRICLQSDKKLPKIPCVPPPATAQQCRRRRILSSATRAS